MNKPERTRNQESEPRDRSLFALKGGDDLIQIEPHVHKFGHSLICTTDSRGHATPNGRSPLEIVVDASEGFIPLWAKDMILRWRFNTASLSFFQQPEALKTRIRELLGEAIVAWGDAAPIRFSEYADAADFEIVVRQSDDCSINGCVLASAFFPDSGRHQLVIYPKMFEQSRDEQVDTLLHEIGHVFGLRHFFANVSESAWPSEIFGVHRPFSIMNYGANSELTDDDKNDLKRLYETAWSGELTDINGTPIVLVRPYHYLGDVIANMDLNRRLQPSTTSCFLGDVVAKMGANKGGQARK